MLKKAINVTSAIALTLFTASAAYAQSPGGLSWAEWTYIYIGTFPGSIGMQ